MHFQIFCLYMSQMMICFKIVFTSKNVPIASMYSNISWERTTFEAKLIFTCIFNFLWENICLSKHCPTQSSLFHFFCRYDFYKGDWVIFNEIIFMLIKTTSSLEYWQAFNVACQKHILAYGSSNSNATQLTIACRVHSKVGNFNP